MPKFVPIDEAARKLGVHRTTLYRYVRQGKLRRYKAGVGDPKTYVDLAELRRMTRIQPLD